MVCRRSCNWPVRGRWSMIIVISKKIDTNKSTKIVINYQSLWYITFPYISIVLGITIIEIFSCWRPNRGWIKLRSLFFQLSMQRPALKIAPVCLSDLMHCTYHIYICYHLLLVITCSHIYRRSSSVTNAPFDTRCAEGLEYIEFWCVLQRMAWWHVHCGYSELIVRD